MEIKHKLISADSHAGFDRDDFTKRMSASKWGERIPHIVELKENGKRIDRWSVNGEPPLLSWARASTSNTRMR